MGTDSRKFFGSIQEVITHYLRIRIGNRFYVVSDNKVSTSSRKVSLDTDRRYGGRLLHSSKITVYIIVLIRRSIATRSISLKPTHQRPLLDKTNNENCYIVRLILTRRDNKNSAGGILNKSPYRIQCRNRSFSFSSLSLYHPSSRAFLNELRYLQLHWRAIKAQELHPELAELGELVKRSGKHQREFFSLLLRYKLRLFFPRLNLFVKHMNSLQCILIHYENNPIKLSSV